MDRVLFSPKPTVRSVLVANERAKLTATYVNAFAGAIFTVGGLAPIFATLLTAGPQTLPMPAIVGVAIVCWMTSATLHYSARRYLKELQ